MVALASCGSRPLARNEQIFADSIMGPALEAESVRIVQGAVVGLMKTEIPPRPRTTCREKLHPARSEAVPGIFPAMALGHGVYYKRSHWQRDFLADWPDEIDLPSAMLLAHELTHVWQWQSRAVTGYHPFKASYEHVDRDDPYLIEIDPEKPFLDYSYEQQGAIVEEFVCCRTLDPAGERTAELHRLVAEVFPAAVLNPADSPRKIRLPWPDTEVRGICSR